MPAAAMMLRGATAGGGGSTLPVAGAVLWLKPDATTMYIDHPATTLVAGDGDPVRVWKDQSGNANDCFHDSGYPLYRPGVTNRGKPSVGFEGSMSLTVPAGVLGACATAGEGEVFVVLKNRAGNTASARGLWTFGNSGESTPSTYCWSDGLFYNDFGSNARKNSISPGQDLSDAFSVLNIWSKTNDWALVLDAVSLFTTASNTVQFPTGGQTFGSMPTGSLDAYAQDLVIFPFKLSSGDRTLMNTFLTT